MPLKYAIWHGRRYRRRWLSEMRKRVVMLKMRRHHGGGLWWHRSFADISHLLVLVLFVVLISSTLVLEIGGAFVFVGLAILLKG